MSSLTDITLTAAERKALAVVVEHSEIRRKSVSAAYRRLDDLGLVIVRETDNIFDREHIIRATFDGENYLYPEELD
jgi:hypothetical protein